jgi:CRISPR/Cas system-associated endonuclease/helicase Cas3
MIGLGSAVANLLDQVTKYETFYLIRDRDLLTDEQIREIHEKYSGKVFVWKARSIENYLLVPDILMQVLNQLGVKTFDNRDAVLKALKEIADSLRTDMLSDMVEYDVRRKLAEIDFSLPPAGTEKDLEEKILQVSEAKRTRLIEQLSDDALKKILEEKKAFINSVWDTNYLQLSDGKRILQEFINRYIRPQRRNIDVESLESLIVNYMKSAKMLPEDIREVMNQILKS